MTYFVVGVTADGADARHTCRYYWAVGAVCAPRSHGIRVLVALGVLEAAFEVVDTLLMLRQRACGPEALTNVVHLVRNIAKSRDECP